MTNNSKQEKAPKDVELPKEHIDQTSDEKASASATKFKTKFWKYGLLTFIIVLSLIYVITNPSFDTNSIPNKFEKVWNTGLNLLLTSEGKATDSSRLKNIDISETVQSNAYAAKTNISKNNISDLEEKITILQEKLEVMNERFRSVDKVTTTAGSSMSPKTSNDLEQLLQNQRRLEEILTTLTDRVVSLEREENTRLAAINKIQQVLRQQQKNVAVVSDRLVSKIESLDRQEINKRDKTLQSPMLVFSLGHLLTTIRQERPFTIQLESLRLNSTGKLEIEKYVDRLEKYAATGILSLSSLLKKLELIKDNQSRHEEMKRNGMLGGGLISDKVIS
ncbi:hypothetical protein OAN59_04495 [Alphaproteobacteria bacterium]|nr:hypothetical protein [Alphaproteobacteria bacterium]